MRSLVFVALVTLGAGPATAAPGPVAHEAPARVEAQFPLPADATTAPRTKGGGGRIRLHKVPRGRAIVIAEVKAALAKGGWQIVSEQPSPSGNALRMAVKKHDRTWKVSFTGNAKQTAIILTVPG